MGRPTRYIICISFIRPSALRAIGPLTVTPKPVLTQWLVPCLPWLNTIMYVRAPSYFRICTSPQRKKHTHQQVLVRTKKKRCQPDIIQDRRVIPQPSHNSHYQVPGTRYSGACDLPDHVGLENINIITKPTNSPTEGQPSPRKSRLKVAFGPLFPTTNIFSWVGIDIYVGNTLQETQPNKKINANTILPFLLFI